MTSIDWGDVLYNQAWHVRGETVTHLGPSNQGPMAQFPFRDTTRCGLQGGPRWVQGPAPQSGWCPGCIEKWEGN